MEIIKASSKIDMSSQEFREAGHTLVDLIAGFLEEIPGKPVTRSESPSTVRKLLQTFQLIDEGQETTRILEESAELLFEHSLLTGHPRFWGYISSSAAPIGALADMLAASVNANVGAFALSPMATEIERQTIEWLARLIGYDPACGGLFVSGGNMANFHGFLAARKYKLGDVLRTKGIAESIPAGKKLTLYCAGGTHTWVNKAAELFGHGTEAIRWVDLAPSQQMNTVHLRQLISNDLADGHLPFMVIGNAGAVATGVIDPLQEIADICRDNQIWFHIDGAYGAPAALLPELQESFRGLQLADSIALDPHKWLFSPLEAGCILVRDPKHLQDTFSFHPEYYNFDGDASDAPLNYFEYGVQNSRGFRALKVWLSIRQIGKNGIAESIRKNIMLTESFFKMVSATPELEAASHHLSITCFRYVPGDLHEKNPDAYLDELNKKLLLRLQEGGEIYLSNAVIEGRYYLRLCIVNFRTSQADLEATVSIILREGRRLIQT